VTFYSRSHSPITNRSRHHHTTPVTVADSDLQAQTEGVLNSLPPLGDGPQFITEPMLAREELAICSAG
ncbi:hypothetical protein T12_10323, partial [Trichinella patagoniensis]